MYDDEQGRVADDENSVVSLVTGCVIFALCYSAHWLANMLILVSSSTCKN